MLTVMPEINYNALRVIGAGINTVVITDEKYAIKIGRIDEISLEELIKLSKHGIAVPIYYYGTDIDIQKTFFDFLKNTPIYSAGDIVSYEDYIFDNGTNVFTDILVVGLADTYQSHDNLVVEREYSQDIRDVIAQLSEKAWELNIRWTDDHIYNIGIYNGNPVILDL